jgi:hypothetical protein
MQTPRLSHVRRFALTLRRELARHLPDGFASNAGTRARARVETNAEIHV